MVDDVKKFVSSDPNEIASKVDSNRVDSLLKEGEGSNLILGSITKAGTILGDGAVTAAKGVYESEVVSGVTGSIVGVYDSFFGDETQTGEGSSKIAINKALEAGVAAATNGPAALTKLAGVHGANVLSSLKTIDAMGAVKTTFTDVDVSGMPKEYLGEDATNAVSSMAGSVNGLALTGDIFSMDKAFAAMNSYGIPGVAMMQTMMPNLLPTLLSNFDLSKLMPGLPSSVQNLLGDKFNDIVNGFSNDWMWLDKENKIYNYETLANLSTWSILFLQNNPAYTEVLALARGLNEHKRNTKSK